MPELPEVETIRRHLAPAIEGRTIVGVEVRRERTTRRNSDSSEVVDRLTGMRIEALGRHGKFLFAVLGSGEMLVVHLGMSGRLELVEPGGIDKPHTNAIFALSDGSELRFVDPRTFGFVGVFDRIPAELGPDALLALPDSRRFREAMSRTGRAVKTVLLDQRVIAGLGNIYTDEILWRAEVAPDRGARTLVPAAVDRIRRAIPPVLEEAISFGGTSLGDLAYLLPDGRAGDNLERLDAYGRHGLPCRRCGSILVRSVVGSRSSSHCLTCQR